MLITVFIRCIRSIGNRVVLKSRIPPPPAPVGGRYQNKLGGFSKGQERREEKEGKRKNKRRKGGEQRRKGRKERKKDKKREKEQKKMIEQYTPLIGN